MRGLPGGTVSFLLTDIVGSTRLWERAPGAMRDALLRHEAILQQAVEAHGGLVLKQRGEGDSAFCVFERAGDALTAACQAQAALRSEPPGEVTPLWVRMAVHAGEAERWGGDYYGPAVNRAARLRQLAHGGQILVSAAAAELARDALPPGVRLRPLGQHRLKDLSRPEVIYQAEAPGLPSDFPPLASVDAFPNNLPVQLTSFVGREGALRAVREALAASRLVTLTGPGGSGKSRLAVQAAAEVLQDYRDGVWLVELAAISDPDLVPAAVGSVVRGGESLEDLSAALAGRWALVVLDNCEHLLGACARLALVLLQSCPDLRLLVTSREPLGLAAEAVVDVPPLELPSQPTEQSVGGSEAGRLFCERARLVRPGFRLQADNAEDVWRIVTRLDGIPLALELAAARLHSLSVREMVRRLDDRFRLLGRPRPAPLPRHQTLQAAVDWSYRLLSRRERLLFARLSVFPASFSLDAAEAVCGGEPLREADVEPLLASLVERSLVAHEDHGSAGSRFRMLETIREYARSKLRDPQDADQLRDRLLAWCAQTVTAANPLPVEERVSIIGRERDNVRASLDWSCIRPGLAQVGLRLAISYGNFCQMVGGMVEAESYLDTLLALAKEPAPERCDALRLHSVFVDIVRCDSATFEAEALESVALARALGDRARLVKGLRFFISAAMKRRNWTGAEEAYREAKRLCEEDRQLRKFLPALDSAYAAVLCCRGDPASAQELLSSILPAERGDMDQFVHCLRILAICSLFRGQFQRALHQIQEAGSLAVEAGLEGVACALLLEKAEGFLGLGALDDAAAAVEEARSNWPTWRLGAIRSWGHTLLGEVRRRQGRLTEAASLLERAQEILERGGEALDYVWSVLLVPLGRTYWQMGRREEGIGCLVRAVVLRGPLDWRPPAALGIVAAEEGRLEEAARLLGVAEAVRRAIGWEGGKDEEVEACLQTLRARLGPARLEALWSEAAALPREEALELAAQVADELQRTMAPAAAPARPDGGAGEDGGLGARAGRS